MRRWAGPPPLLIAVTVLGILVAPAVSRADADPPSDQPSSQPSGQSAMVVAASDVASEGPATPTTPTASPTSTATTTPAPAPALPQAPSERPTVPAIKPRRVGIATFNQYVELSTEAATEDALALTDRADVSIIGWQEGYSAGPVYQRLAQEGWGTRRYVATKGARELAVSWRKDEFAFVGSALHELADGVSVDDGRYPFGTRYALRVTLRDRASGQTLSVLDTHLPQRIEDLDHPGTWRTTKNAVRGARQLEGLAELWETVPGRWVIGTGDYNIAALADQRARNNGGVVRAYAGVARSSYSLLGFEGLEATHPTSRRYIDYVHAYLPDLRSGRIEMLRQRTPGGLNSDHRPLVVTMRLS